MPPCYVLKLFDQYFYHLFFLTMEPNFAIFLSYLTDLAIICIFTHRD